MIVNHSGRAKQTFGKDLMITKQLLGLQTELSRPVLYQLVLTLVMPQACTNRNPHMLSPWDTHYTMQQVSRSCAISKVFTSMTGPEKTGLIYAKCTRLYYSTYLVFWMCYSQSVNFIESLIDFYIQFMIKYAEYYQEVITI